MSQISVAYATKTKHSQKLAEAIGKALHVKAEDVKGGSASHEADLLFIVGGIYAGKSSPELTRYVEGLSASQVKMAVLVTSSASATNRNQPEIRRILTEKNIKVLDEIGCPGNFLFLTSGHPNAADMEQVAERAKQIAAGYETEKI
ncbi:MAG: hypothetical protein VB106_20445 [Clostridiaceae bacterium]|nr:hypothetical protein [Clostridiaceae bacterium]